MHKIWLEICVKLKLNFNQGFYGFGMDNVTRVNEAFENVSQVMFWGLRI